MKFVIFFFSIQAAEYCQKRNFENFTASECDSNDGFGPDRDLLEIYAQNCTERRVSLKNFRSHVKYTPQRGKDPGI